MDRHARTIFKTLTWGLPATSTTLSLAYIVTQDYVISASIGIAEIVVKTTIYYVHERMWDKTDFGRKTQGQAV